MSFGALRNALAISAFDNVLEGFSLVTSRRVEKRFLGEMCKVLVDMVPVSYVLIRSRHEIVA